MADTGSGGARVPQSVGEKLSFATPVIIVGLILSVAISGVILWAVDGKTREVLEATKTDLVKRTDALTTLVSEAEKARVTMEKTIVKLEAKTDTLEKGKEELAGLLKDTIAQVKGTSDDLTSFKKGQQVEDKTQNTDIKHNADMTAGIDRRVIYVEEKLKKLDAIEKDVVGLKNDTGELKQEYVKLKGDLNAVRTKGDATEKDLTDLGERARLFQLRVLTARAREAADAARKVDIKTLISRLEDVEEGKK